MRLVFTSFKLPDGAVKKLKKSFARLFMVMWYYLYIDKIHKK